MRIAVTGSHGLIGSALVPALEAAGHQVIRVARHDVGFAVPQGSDAVVHLAGENIAAGRWTPAKKAAIRDSRVTGTRRLCEALAQLAPRPRVLVCASAVGIYGSRGEEVLTEESRPGAGFLAEVARAWEQAADPAQRAGIRVVSLRFGMVLSPRGGALAKMLLPFRLGLGGPIGSGRQYWSWVALEDVVGVVPHVLGAEDVRGPVNVVSPQAVTNREFTTALGRALRRPTIFPVPAFAARLVFGEMADELLLASARATPTILTATRYRFRGHELGPALRRLLRSPA